MRHIFAFIALLFTTQLFAEVRFSAEFSGGSIGGAEYLKDSLIHINNKTVSTSIYKVSTKLDPINNHKPESHRSNRWFYFMVTGVKGKTITLDINYNDSQRPFYSYDNENFTRYSEEEVPTRNGRITKHYERDTIYVAYFVPYTIERGNRCIERWERSPYVKKISIGRSGLGEHLNILRVTDTNTADVGKKIIYIHGRVHPSETPCSFHLEAMVDKLTDGSEHSMETLKNSIFYILPITNPDGVANGLSRSTPDGVNQEVDYIDENSCEVRAIQQFLLSLKASGEGLDLMLNMHSQSTPKTTYWVHNAASTNESYNRRLMLFAGLTTYRNPYFGWRDLSYSTLKPHFIEGWIGKEFKHMPIAQTFETPYSYYGMNPNGEWVTLENLRSLATNSLNAISDFLALSSSERASFGEPKSSRGFKKSKRNDLIYFGESYLTARRAGEAVTYQCELSEGDYALYRWSVGQNTHMKNFNQNEWIYVGRHTQQESGSTEITFKSKLRGERFDQILFVKIKE